LHQTNVAVGGAVVAELFLVGALAIPATRSLESRSATFGSLVGLLASLALLAAAEALRSMPILLLGTALAGICAAVGYRGSLQVVNQLAPAERRAEVISSYLVVGFLGNSLPVIGVGLLSRISTPVIADLSFATLIAVLAIVALATGIKFAPNSWPQNPHGVST
jgi:MFS family permease